MNRKEVMYQGSLMGDPEAVDIIQIGEGEPTELSSMDAEKILFEGAPLGAVVADKKKRPASGPEKVARLVETATVGMSGIRLPHIILANGVLIGSSVRAKLAGQLLERNLEQAQIIYPGQMVTRTLAGDSAEAEQTIEFGTAEATEAGLAHFGLAVLFASLITKSDSGRSGAEITIWLEFTPASREGDWPALIATPKSTIRRQEGSQPLDIILHPFVQAGDIIISRWAVFGPDLILPATGPEQKLIVHVAGLMDGETLQVSTPGYDSIKYQNYLKRFKVNIL